MTSQLRVSLLISEYNKQRAQENIKELKEKLEYLKIRDKTIYDKTGKK